VTPPDDKASGLYDAKGRWVPDRLIKAIDRARHELVVELAQRAAKEEDRLAAFKASVLEEIDAFVSLSAESYGVKLGGAKGNVTLMSHDGRYKIIRAVADHLTFDERLQAAKHLVDDCIRDWTQDSPDEVRALVHSAFQVDKAGKISTERVLTLRRLNIDDPRWHQAMRAIGDSVQVATSKAYVRFYERIGDTDKYRAINLDLSSVGER
jgi:hypothetical protein